jgi:hypothetical protein
MQRFNFARCYDIELSGNRNERDVSVDTVTSRVETCCSSLSQLTCKLAPLDSCVMRLGEGRGVHEAILIALEGLQGKPNAWLLSYGENRKAMREHVLRWVHEYAERRGVVLADQDIVDELDRIIEEVKKLQ